MLGSAERLLGALEDENLLLRLVDLEAEMEKAFSSGGYPCLVARANWVKDAQNPPKSEDN